MKRGDNFMSKKMKINFVANVFLAVFSLVTLVFFLIFATEFLVAAYAEEDGLGRGLGMALCLVIMIICDVFRGVIMLIGAITSLFARRRLEGRAKKLITAMGVFDIASFGLSFVTTAVFVLMNNFGAF